jgi:protocatechuate 3,4-dioxygenase beta subunit
MNRILVVGVGALVASVLAVWLLSHHRRDAGTSHVAVARRTTNAIPATAPPPLEALQASTEPEGQLRLEGQVVGPDGSGVAGAAVVLAVNPIRSVTTDDDGSFTFDQLVGRTFALSASRGELASGWVEHKLTATSDPVVIQIVQGGALAITVVSESGDGIGAAKIEVLGLGAKATTTDEHGRAVVRPVPLGWVAVRVTAGGYAPGSTVTSVANAEVPVSLTITLHRGVSLDGRVVDEVGAPIEGAHVTANLEGATISLGTNVATCDDHGRFGFAVLAPGSYVISARDGVHAPSNAAPVAVEAAPITGVEIVMPRGGVIAGVVSDATGHRAPFAAVRVAGREASPDLADVARATADAQGQFELRGLPRTKLRAVASADDAVSKLVELDLSAMPAIRELQLVVEAPAVITGIVVDERGQPAPEVRVTAIPDMLSGGGMAALSTWEGAPVTTDGAGGFTLRLPPGPYRLWAMRAGGAIFTGGDLGTTAHTGDRGVRLVLASPGALIGRIVIDGGAAPPTHATVTVGLLSSATASADGTFRIADLKAERTSARIRGAEFAELVVPDIVIEPGKTTDLGTITVHRGRRVVGRVVDTTGAPIAGARVRLGRSLDASSDDTSDLVDFGDVASARSDRDGSFVVVGVGARESHVVADHSTRGRSNAATVPAGTDDPPAVTLVLRAFGSVAGKVTSKGKPVVGAEVSAMPKDGSVEAAKTETTDDGSFLLARVPEGELTIVASSPAATLLGATNASAQIQVTAGKQTHADIAIAAGDITVEVQLAARAGAKLDGAELLLIPGAVNVHTAKALDPYEGRSAMRLAMGVTAPETFDDVLPGTYSLCAVPITGSLTDPTLLAWLEDHQDEVVAYCRPLSVGAVPAKQTVALELPGMQPLAPTH